MTAEKSETNDAVQISTHPETMDPEDFQELMKERTKSRKKREDYNVAELRVKIGQLEQALTAEVRRRVETTKAVKESADEKIDALEKRLSSRLDEQTAFLSGRIKEIEERLTSYEELLVLESTQQQKKIKDRGAELKAQLRELHHEIKNEAKNRMVQEGRVLSQLESCATDMERRWKTEQESRIEEIGKLTLQFQTRDQRLHSEQNSWQTEVSKELEELKKELEAEVQERQAEDDVIVSALQTYTQQLQQSLSILNDE
eukprot:CAMPEP_0194205882 /NCGR_PEP_ID=MMETSP0156-20130528/5056_1 /TAXON_ID=33649 /ORGANISM="Thalassionema nitzschioides, Strain L26-B" /LENGTH=257 /DNA_ID=CAMNT_0038932267 /DNA_START=102 /DNA_END=875 /DNA_ORIENTATION=+